MNTMRLAFICTEKLPVPAVRGGAIQILIDGIAPLIAKTHRLTVLSVAAPGLPAREIVRGVEHIRFPKTNYSYHITKYLRANRQTPFDVIHVFNRPAKVYLYKQAAPGTRFVLSLHNEMFNVKKISRVEAKKCVNSVDKILTVSKFIARTVSVRVPEARGKLKTVYSGAELNRYVPVWSAGEKRSALRARLGLTNKKAIISVGRLSKKKGVHVLVEAFKQVLPRHPNTVLLIVGSRWFGDNSVDDYVEKLYDMSRPIRDKVIFTNFVSPDKVPDYYLASDIFVCSSQWREPLARVHYEAMAAGLPVITTDRGGNAEVVTNFYNGIVINDYSNPAAFAKALEFLLSNPAKAMEMGRRGREMAERHFNFSRMAQELQSVYEEEYKKKSHDTKIIIKRGNDCGGTKIQ